MARHEAGITGVQVARAASGRVAQGYQVHRLRRDGRLYLFAARTLSKPMAFAP